MAVDGFVADPSPWVLPRYRYSMPCVLITHVLIFSYIFIRNILTGGYIFSILVFTQSRDFQTGNMGPGTPFYRLALHEIYVDFMGQTYVDFMGETYVSLIGNMGRMESIW